MLDVLRCAENKMKFLVLALFVVGAYGCSLPTFPSIVSRVVGGQDVRPHSWPWQISLQNNFDGEWTHSCGGTLISDQWVLTAAHCFGNMEHRVALGEHSMKDNEDSTVYKSPAAIIVHEKWDSSLIHNDIALIKLESPVSFSDSVMAACLPEAGFILPHDAPCYVTGWGKLYSDGPLADILQQALLPVVDDATCSKPDWWGLEVIETMLCAGGDGVVGGCNASLKNSQQRFTSIQSDTKSASMGPCSSCSEGLKQDSGGPLNCQNQDGAWEVHGIVSYGPKICNTYKKPTIFTRVSSYMDWISAKMAAN